MPHHDTSHKREQTSLSSTATSLSVSAQQMNRKGEMRTDAPLPNVPAIASCAAQPPTTNAKLEEGKFFDPGVSNQEGAAMDRAVLDQLSPVSAMMDRYFPGSVVPPEGTASGVRRVGDIPPTDHDESVHSAMDVPSTCETFTSLPDYHEEESITFQLCEETVVTQKDAAKRVPTAKRSTHPRPSVSPGTRRVSATVGTATSTTAMHRPAYKRPGATRSRTSHTATSSSPSPPPPASTAANWNHGAPATHCDPNATRAAQKLAPHIPHLEIGGATTARIGKDHKSSERRSTNSRLSTGRRVSSRSVEYLSPHSARGATGSTDTAGRPAGHHTQRSASQRFNHLYCPHKESVVVVDRSQFMPNLKHPPLPRELFGRPLEKIGCAARACFAPRSSSRRYVENESLPTSAAVSPRSNPHGLSCEVQPADVHAPGPYSPMRGGESYGDGLIRQLQSSAHPPRSSTVASPSPSYHPQHSKKPTSEEIMPLYSSFQFNGRGAPMTFRSHQFFRTGFEDPYNKRTKFLVEKGPKLTLERQLHLNARLSRPRLY